MRDLWLRPGGSSGDCGKRSDSGDIWKLELTGFFGRLERECSRLDREIAGSRYLELGHKSQRVQSSTELSSPQTSAENSGVPRATLTFDQGIPTTSLRLDNSLKRLTEFTESSTLMITVL